MTSEINKLLLVLFECGWEIGEIAAKNAPISTKALKAIAADQFEEKESTIQKIFQILEERSAT